MLRKVRRTGRLQEAPDGGEQRTEQIHARVAPSDVARLERIAKLSGEGYSWAIRRGLELLELDLVRSAARSKGKARR